MKQFDVAVIGAGAAGMMCAAVAGQRGRRVVLIDHAVRIGEKIRISGGGRCNFTNLHAGPSNFLSANPRFCRSALAGYSPAEFVAMVRRHGIAYHEKHRGQLFCDGSAEGIIEMLKSECGRGNVTMQTGCKVDTVHRDGTGFLLRTQVGELSVAALVIGTGGLSIPKIGATDFGYRVARQFGLKVVEPLPGLVPLIFDGDAWQGFASLAGIALEVDIECAGPYGRGSYREALLFTHRGLSGPAVLQISNHWRAGASIHIDLAPDVDWDAVVAQKGLSRGHAAGILGAWFPKRLAETWVAKVLTSVEGARPVADLSDKSLRRLAESVCHWRVQPAGTEGFRKAEVTVGGVDTRGLSSRTMEVQGVPGLYFIGEVLDVTGWLGGYNFQWAWASAVACGRAL